MAKQYQVQEFAALTCVTVKALHHYDRLGLLKPRRTAAGYRLYAERDMERLEQIVALKFLGLPLRQIKIVLERTALQLPDALRMQREALAEKQELLARAMRAITDVQKTMENGKPADLAILKRLIEVIGMQNDIDAMKQYYSEEAWVKMRPRYAEGPSQEWIEMYREVEAALGEDPAGEKAQELAARWMEQVKKTTGGDMEVQVGAMKAWADYRNWPAAMRQRAEEHSLDKIAPFIGQALAAHRKKYYSDAAWAKVTASSQDERFQLEAAWSALFLEVGAALDDDPASERVQALCERWMELTEKSSGSDMGVSMGWTKAWGDRQNWPEFARQRVEENHLDKIVPFIGQALEAHKKKYYSDAAWAKVTGRPQDERTQLGAAWAALLREVGAALDDDPASERAQALYMRWMELAEKTSGGDTETSMGWKNAWADRANWPAHAQQQISSFHLEEVMEFIRRAAAHSVNKRQ